MAGVTVPPLFAVEWKKYKLQCLKNEFFQVLINFAAFLIWMDLIMVSEKAPAIISKNQWKGASENDVMYEKHKYRVFHDFFGKKLFKMFNWM